MTTAKKRPGECKFIAVVCHRQATRIFTALFKFCEGINPIVPGNTTFKLSMLNREMNQLVLKFYMEASPIEFAHNHSKHCIIKALDSEPFLKKYYQNKKVLRNVVAAFGSNVFGGSVFNPIKHSNTGLGGTKEKPEEVGKKILKSNNLVD